MEKKWEIKEQGDPGDVKFLQKRLGISEILANLLVLRNILTYEDAHQFFRPKDGMLHDPFLMHGMRAAVDRIERSIRAKKRIMIYGDYDVDGTSAVALVYSHLSIYYDNLEYYIPDRYKEGYGISSIGMETAKAHNVDLIIALDCGIKAHDEIDQAKSYGIDMIVCDHHTPDETLPNAIILNPKKAKCEYPFKELPGCGIGFKLMQAFAYHQGNDFEAVEELLDLVALAIAADIVPITQENRTLASLGIRQIQRSARPGIRAILEPADKLERCNIADLVFTVAPRINAAGRIKSGNAAVELLTCTDFEEANKLSEAINELNNERREIEQGITAEALSMVEGTENDKSTVVYNKDWHKGVIGIVASRLIENYYRPTVVLTDSGDVAAGSVRSVRGFNVYEALQACADHMIQFGGHKYAAGLTIEKDQIPAFKEKFEDVVASTIPPELLIPTIRIDMEIDFSNIQNGSMESIPKFYRILEQFAPYGPGNMRPVFISRNVEAAYPQMVGDNHLQFTAFQENDNRYRCIGFNLGDKLELLKAPFDIAYTIERNSWNGRESLQLNVKDIRKAENS